VSTIVKGWDYITARAQGAVRRVKHVGNYHAREVALYVQRVAQTESVFEVFPMNPVAITRIPGLRQSRRFAIISTDSELICRSKTRSCRAAHHPCETTEVE